MKIKVTISVFISLLITISSFSQNRATIYCKMISYFTNKQEELIKIDFGNNINAFITDTTEKNKLLKVKTYSSSIDAMNYMHSLGWELIQIVYAPYNPYKASFGIYNYFYRRELEK